MSERTSYVCGFLFSDGLYKPRVLLIRKARPDWQKDRLNGIGGRIEADETPEAAMDREFTEEAGVAGISWQKVAVLTHTQWVVHFFSAYVEHEVFDSARTTTDEPIVRVNVADLPHRKMIPNLRVLIPLALDQTGIVKPVMLTDAGPVAP